MDFSDMSSYPMVANPDYSPAQDSYSYPEQLDKAYIADAYTTSPDHSLSTFLDCDTFFDRPLNSVELPAGFAPKSQAVFNATLPATGLAAANMNSNTNSAFRQSFNAAPFGQIEPFSSGFSFDPTSDALDLSPQTSSSRTPSLCGDGPQQTTQPTSPSASPRFLKRESPSSPASLEEEPTPKRPQRKRGRPRLDRNASDAPSATLSTAKCQRTTRLPHNQVERKYREGLNSELERLRRAVPTLPQSDEGGVMGQPKPSKAMVLAGAIEYIKKVERERDMLRDECERLKLGGRGWKANDELDEFLIDP